MRSQTSRLKSLDKNSLRSFSNCKPLTLIKEPSVKKTFSISESVGIATFIDSPDILLFKTSETVLKVFSDGLPLNKSIISCSDNDEEVFSMNSLTSCSVGALIPAEFKAAKFSRVERTFCETSSTVARFVQIPFLIIFVIVFFGDPFKLLSTSARESSRFVESIFIASFFKTSTAALSRTFSAIFINWPVISLKSENPELRESIFGRVNFLFFSLWSSFCLRFSLRSRFLSLKSLYFSNPSSYLSVKRPFDDFAKTYLNAILSKGAEGTKSKTLTIKSSDGKFVSSSFITLTKVSLILSVTSSAKGGIPIDGFILSKMVSRFCPCNIREVLTSVSSMEGGGCPYSFNHSSSNLSFRSAKSPLRI